MVSGEEGPVAGLRWSGLGSMGAHTQHRACTAGATVPGGAIRRGRAWPPTQPRLTNKTQDLRIAMIGWVMTKNFPGKAA